MSNFCNNRISFCTWNINGLYNKTVGDKTKSDDFLNIISKHDFITITETWTDDVPNVPGYLKTFIAPMKIRKRNISKTYGRKSGGICIYYKNEYKNHFEVISSSNNSIWCKISKKALKTKKDLYLCSVYIPPDNSSYFNSQIFESLENEIDLFLRTGNDMILLGDFNARTGKSKDSVSSDGNNYIANDQSDLAPKLLSRQSFDSVCNSHGDNLLNLCKTFDLTILNGRVKGDSLGQITYHGAKGVSTVDYIITNQQFFPNINYFIVNQPTPLSDHSPISAWTHLTKSHLTLNDSSNNLNKLQSLPFQFHWSFDSAENFKNAMASPTVVKAIDNFLQKQYLPVSASTINDAIKDIQSIYINASKLSLKLKKPKSKRKINSFCNKKWFDSDCKQTRNELRKLSNLKHAKPLDLSTRQSYHIKLKQFKKLLKTKKRSFHDEVLTQIENNKDTSMFWKLLNSADETIKEEELPPIHEDKWIDHFQSLHQKCEDVQKMTDKLKQLEEDNRNDNNDNILNEQISEEEILTCAKLLKNNKAAFNDKIRNEMIRHSIEFLLPVYSKLFNLILDSGIYPDTWCVGSITPIFKSGDRNDPNNYRGICVSSCLGKFFTLIMNKRLLNFAAKNDLLHKSQIGFLPNHRTTDHIFTLRTIIDKYVKNARNGKIYACFIDFKKAFDSIWHVGLFVQLLKNNINGKFYQLIQNIYSKSSCFIKLGQKRTKTFDYNRGVRQGCIISPFLFNLYLNELPKLLDTTPHNDPIFLPNGSKLSSLLYADDLVLLSHSRKGLQNNLNAISKFCKEWKMIVNERKSKTMIFSNKKVTQQPFILNSKTLDSVNEFTYLGVKMSSTGNFNPHLKQIKEKALHAFFKITRKIDFKKLRPSQANKIFDSFVSPILTYSSEIWSLYSNQNFEKWDKTEVEKCHLRFCRYFLGVSNKASNVACRGELGRFPLKIFIDKLSIKFFNHLICLSDDTFAKQSLLMSFSLFKRKKKCYFSNLKQMLDRVDSSIWPVSIERVIDNDTLMNLESSMKNNYFQVWKNVLKNSSKLSFYSTFKEFYEQEPYLNVLRNFEQRRLFTKFRISNHQLAIETGRYYNIPRDDRLCSLCKTNMIETEQHLILHCPTYSNFRSEFQSKLKEKIDFSTDYVQTLTKSTDKSVLMYFSIFIWKCFQFRKQKLTK